MLTDTTHLGLAYDATVRYLAARDPVMQDLDIVIPVVAETDDGFLRPLARRARPPGRPPGH